MRIVTTGLALLMIAMLVQPAISATSVYTTLDFEKGCKPVGGTATPEEEGMGSQSLLCHGYKGYPVRYDQDDERTTIHYGDQSEATTASGWESFSAFNSAVDRFEWRLDDKGVPFAAIHRFLISSGEQNSPGIKASNSGQVLVISKVGQPKGPAGCVVGLVDALANADANDMARQLADALVPQFACGKDKPGYHGKRGAKSSDFTVSFDE